MIEKSEQSIQLYKMMISMGYTEEFANEITKNLNTDFTATRLMGYLDNYGKMPEVEVVDEMLAIISDRNRIMKKKELENTNAKLNEYMNEGLL